MFILKISVDFLSFFRKGIKEVKDDFMIALINGYQGSGKTYYSIYRIEKEYRGRTIYTNVLSYKSKYNNVVYFTRLEDIYDNHSKNAIFLIDELSKKFVKDSRIDRQFYSWLQQSRKHQRHVYLITQEYLQVPNWLRGIAILSYTTRKLPLIPLFITTLGTPVLDKETCEWTIEEHSIEIYKRNKCISDRYDTYELINEL